MAYLTDRVAWLTRRDGHAAVTVLAGEHRRATYLRTEHGGALELCITTPLAVGCACAVYGGGSVWRIGEYIHVR